MFYSQLLCAQIPKYAKAQKRVTAWLYFLHFWDLWVKAAHKILVKFTPGVNFINIAHARFAYEIFVAKISNPKASFVVFGAKILYKKCACKMLMKLTPDHCQRKRRLDEILSRQSGWNAHLQLSTISARGDKDNINSPFHRRHMHCVINLTWLNLLTVRGQLRSVFATHPTASKNDTHFKSDQNDLGAYVDIEDRFLCRQVLTMLFMSTLTIALYVKRLWQCCLCRHWQLRFSSTGLDYVVYVDIDDWALGWQILTT